MGFKKLVTLVCDGPCGKTSPDTSSTPVGWHKVDIQTRVVLTAGQVPPGNDRMWLCPNCYAQLLVIFNQEHFSISMGSLVEQFDVVEVSIKTNKVVNFMGTNRTKNNAEAVVNMAVLRRGVETSFYAVVPANAMKLGDDYVVRS